jgi:hypothetical protein
MQAQWPSEEHTTNLANMVKLIEMNNELEKQKSKEKTEIPPTTF